jgi:hypothetical protein
MTAPQGSNGDGPDQATIAFRRLLKDASAGDEARVDALIALSQRKVFAAMWPTAPDEVRTLTNSKGETAMPLFSGIDELKKAARRFGWFQPDGSLQQKELGARAALRQAVARSVQFVVVDIAADHAAEFAPAEIKPLLGAQPKRESTGPFAATGKLSTDLMEAVKRRSYSMRPLSMRPEAVSNSQPPRSSKRSRAAKAGHTVKRRSSLAPPPPPQPPQRPASLPAPPSSPTPSPVDPDKGSETDLPKFAALSQPLNDALIEVLRENLRQFPEVDWACALDIEKGGVIATAIALRVDPALLTRVGAIQDTVRLAADNHHIALEFLLLDTVEITRAARNLGNVFYPWRK